MNLKKLSNEELELLSYTDLTYMILKENKKPMNTPSIFRTICELLSYTDEEYTAKIGDYYTSLTTDRRFILLDTAEWDLRDNHSIKIIVEDDEEEIEEELDEEELDDEDSEEDEKDIDLVIEDDDIDDDEDDIDDLAILADDEIEE